MRLPLATFILAAGVTFTSAAMATPREVSEMERAFASKGPAYVISRYFDCETGEGYRVVASGDPRAVRFAVRLLKYSDACVSELLHSSLGQAMLVARKVVLPYVNTDPMLSAGDICLPFLSAEDPPKTLRPVVAKARRNLLRVKAPRLIRRRNACLGEIESLPANLK